MYTSPNRRTAIRNISLGILGLSTPLISRGISYPIPLQKKGTFDFPDHFPNIDPAIISEVVGKSHFDLDGVKKLVDNRSELAKSVWEWRFGDFESAIGAASHVGRRDIALYLMSKGATPTIFTLAMMGAYDSVQAMIKAYPGIEKTTGPHGISLLDHAYAGERMKDKMTTTEIENLEKTIELLQSLDGAKGPQYLDVTPEEQQNYLGNYIYGDKENEGFTIQLNMRKLLSLGPIGGFGGAMYKLDENLFTYNGAPSVTIQFDWEGKKVIGLRLSDPEIMVEAKKVS